MASTSAQRPPRGVGHDGGLQLVCDVLFLKLEGKTQGVFTLFIIFLCVSEIHAFQMSLKECLKSFCKFMFEYFFKIPGRQTGSCQQAICSSDFYTRKNSC